VAHYTFRSTCWEIKLVVEKDPKSGLLSVSPASTIKNIHPDRRSLERNDVDIRIVPRDADGNPREVQWLLLEGDPLRRYDENAKDKKDLQPALIEKAKPLPNVKITDALELDQIFKWANSPVKRVDKIEVGTKLALSHRTATRTLVNHPQFPVEAAPTDPNATTTGMDPTTTTPAAPGPGPGSRDGEGSGGANTTVKPGVDPLRYFETSKQVRRLPVGMVLVIDQAYIPDVLTAVANSRMQMFTTQTQMRRIGAIQPPQETLTGQPVNPQPGPGVGGPGPIGPPPPAPVGGGMGGAVAGPGPGGGVPPVRSFPPNFPRGTGGLGTPDGEGPGSVPGQNPLTPGSTEDPNLVEFTIYAIASIYEKPLASGEKEPTAP
jgi:hypothetical protein